MVDVSTQNPSHETQLMLNKKYDICWLRHYPYYPVVPDHLVHYLHYCGIEVRKVAFLDTILTEKSNPKSITDRYLVEFYKNGSKLNYECYTERCFRIFLQDYIWVEFYDEPTVPLWNFNLSEVIQYHSFGHNRWQVTFDNYDGIFTLGLMCHRYYQKQITITTDKQGNIVLYLNRNAKQLHSCVSSFRKTGTRYYIISGTNNLKTPKEYIDEIASLIMCKNDDEEGLADMVELLLSDPRMEKELARLLKKLPSSDAITEPFKLERVQILAEYKQKMADLDSRMKTALALPTALQGTSGLIPYSKKISIEKNIKKFAES